MKPTAEWTDADWADLHSKLDRAGFTPERPEPEYEFDHGDQHPAGEGWSRVRTYDLNGWAGSYWRREKK